jgi:hypothetical protein
MHNNIIPNAALWQSMTSVFDYFNFYPKNFQVGGKLATNPFSPILSYG